MLDQDGLTRTQRAAQVAIGQQQSAERVQVAQGRADEPGSFRDRDEPRLVLDFPVVATQRRQAATGREGHANHVDVRRGVVGARVLVHLAQEGDAADLDDRLVSELLAQLPQQHADGGRRPTMDCTSSSSVKPRGMPVTHAPMLWRHSFTKAR